MNWQRLFYALKLVCLCFGQLSIGHLLLLLKPQTACRFSTILSILWASGQHNKAMPKGDWQITLLRILVKTECVEKAIAIPVVYIYMTSSSGNRNAEVIVIEEDTAITNERVLPQYSLSSWCFHRVHKTISWHGAYLLSLSSSQWQTSWGRNVEVEGTNITLLFLIVQSLLSFMIHDILIFHKKLIQYFIDAELSGSQANIMAMKLYCLPFPPLTVAVA